ncbi:MAG: B12-binding domain-containing radical SAM protein [Lentisphaerae bacterium]|nr:B12-binding domain-containing radical SAM protein [Lentisphaerota bacterium]
MFMDVRNIVFLSANASYSHSTLALRYLAGCVDCSRWRPFLVECTIKDGTDSVLSRIEALSPHVLATTFYLFNRQYLKGLTGEFKRRSPACTLVGGGPEFLGDNRAGLKEMPQLDVVVRGEGECAFPSILDCLDDPDARAPIPGVCCLRHGQYVDNGRAVQAEHLDDLPMPYDQFPPSPEKPFVHLETSRGCSNSCSFCTSSGTAPVRTFSIDRTRRELERLQPAGVRQVRLVDRTFNERPRRAVELLRMFREEFPDLGFHLEIDPARLTPSLVEALAGGPAGQLHLEAGIQSLHADALRSIRRAGTVEKTLRGLSELCAMTNLQVHADLIAGLPGTTLDTVLHDLDTLVLLRPAEIQLEILKVLPGTPLAAEAGPLGIRWSPSPPYAVRSTPAMPPDHIRKAQRLSVLVDRFYNIDCLQSIVIQATRSIPGFWRKMLSRFSSRKELTPLRALEKRFLFLDRFLDGKCERARHALHYAWMRKGLSARNGICRAEQIKNGIPLGARLIEGSAEIPVARAYRIEAGKTFIFAYSSGEGHDRIAAVYEVTPD